MQFRRSHGHLQLSCAGYIRGQSRPHGGHSRRIRGPRRFWCCRPGVAAPSSRSLKARPFGGGLGRRNERASSQRSVAHCASWACSVASAQRRSGRANRGRPSCCCSTDAMPAAHRWRDAGDLPILRPLPEAKPRIGACWNPRRYVGVAVRGSCRGSGRCARGSAPA